MQIIRNRKWSISFDNDYLKTTIHILFVKYPMKRLFASNFFPFFLQILCLITTFGFNSAERSLTSNSFLKQSDSTLSRLRNLEDVPARLSRIFGKNSRTRRLHIENQHGLDGKVERININSEEDLPGIRAYGVQKKKLMNNGYIEKSIQREIMKNVEDGSRVTRSVRENIFENKFYRRDNLECK